MAHLVRTCAALGALWLLSGCPSDPAPTEPTGPQADTTCPEGFPRGCKVLRDTSDPAKNTVEYHVLVPDDTKHDPAQKLLEGMYRHLMLRRGTEPAGLQGYLYTAEAQFSTPPPSPVAQVIRRPGDKAPTFENKIPLELWQQVEVALELNKRFDRKLKRQLTYQADPANGAVTVTVPFTQGASEEWAKEVSFLQLMNEFTDITTALYDNIPDLKELTFTARWKDADIARFEVSRADYPKLQLHEIEDKIGSLHGRAFIELASGNKSDAAVTRAHNQRASAEYRKVLTQLKGRALVAPQIK